MQHCHREILHKYRFLFVNSAKKSTPTVFQQPRHFFNLIVCIISLREGSNSVGLANSNTNLILAIASKERNGKSVTMASYCFPYVQSTFPKQTRLEDKCETSAT